MTDLVDEVDPLEETLTTDEVPSPNESLADRLRRSRKQVAANKTHDEDIPGYEGALFCRYRLMSGDELDDILKKARQRTKNRAEINLIVTLDNIIESCEEFYVREGGKEIPLREHETYKGPRDFPVKYDANLAEYLQFANELPDPPTARSVVLGLFGGNDVAASTHGAKISRWMMQGGSELDMMLGGI